MEKNLTEDLAKQVKDLTASNSDLRSALEALVDWCIQFTPEYPQCLLRAKELLSNNDIIETI